MDIRYNFEMADVKEEDVANLFNCINTIMTLVKESNCDSYKIVDLKDKINDLERENRSLKSEISDLKIKEEKKPSKVTVTPCKKVTKFNEVDE